MPNFLEVTDTLDTVQVKTYPSGIYESIILICNRDNNGAGVLVTNPATGAGTISLKRGERAVFINPGYNGDIDTFVPIQHDVVVTITTAVDANLNPLTNQNQGQRVLAFTSIREMN